MMRKEVNLSHSIAGIITMTINIVAAAVLRPAGYTELTSFATPGLALEIILGQWAMIVFFIGVIAASFTSIVPIMWTIPYMILEALDIDHKDGTSKKFK